KTPGINPYYQDTGSIIKTLKINLKPELTAFTIQKIFFYGAGCTEEKGQVVKQALKKMFPNIDIAVNNDLLAAARSTCGHEKGIACILGTGANSCYFDGNSIQENVPPLGYILGDEGSGAYIGIKLLSNFLKGEFPELLHVSFLETYQIKKDTVLEAVYRKPYPNRYLAGFSKFASRYKNHPYMIKLLEEGFQGFFERNVLKYENFDAVPVHFVGSIAFHFKDILVRESKKNKIVLGNISESPITGLIDYHKTS
ncbi:MAG: N-acetylglucosamine kinase, partial [Flammeovirgaceae bacterium]|nr:N-acetylglucosamine kinase [Flammeovirgaceae bacterium]